MVVCEKAERPTKRFRLCAESSREGRIRKSFTRQGDGKVYSGRRERRAELILGVEARPAPRTGFFCAPGRIRLKAKLCQEGCQAERKDRVLSGGEKCSARESREAFFAGKIEKVKESCDGVKKD